MLIKRTNGVIAVAFTNKGTGGILEIRKNNQIEIVRSFDSISGANNIAFLEGRGYILGKPKTTKLCVMQ